jgi:hypothetical protein
LSQAKKDEIRRGELANFPHGGVGFPQMSGFLWQEAVQKLGIGGEETVI